MSGIDSPVRAGSPMGKYQIILNKSLFIHMSGKSLELIGLVELLPFLGCTVDARWCPTSLKSVSNPTEVYIFFLYYIVTIVHRCI